MYNNKRTRIKHPCAYIKMQTKNIWSPQITNNNHYPKYVIKLIEYPHCISKLCQIANTDYYLKNLHTNTPKDDEQYTRKTIGYINHTPAIIATITTTYHTFKKYYKILNELGNKPIGENLLFNKTFNRSKFLFSTIVNNKENIKFNTSYKVLIVRKSTFSEEDNVFELTEIFSPEIPNIIKYAN